MGISLCEGLAIDVFWSGTLHSALSSFEPAFLPEVVFALAIL